MTTDAFHPDHLKPGDMMGPWRIVEPLGSGNFGRVFKVEREGNFFTLKMAVRPAPEHFQDTPQKEVEERQVDARLRHEGAILLANVSHSGLPRLRGIGRWPHPLRGYLYLALDYVPGESFHTWRQRTRPNAAQLVDLFIEVVRVMARLHRHGILIRDFKAEHVIVNPEDNRPMLVDLGSAYLPGGSTLTVGLAPMTPHTLPPECVAFIRDEAWKQGSRFEANQAGDLYQFGVFMYEALTECWPFDPRLTADELLTAIATAVPRAPHRLNPEVPESLSRIALRLLEKRPEDRYESAKALLQALWDAAKERSKKSWKVTMRLPAEGPAPLTQDEVEERRLQKQELERKVQQAQQQKQEQLSREQSLEQNLSLLTEAIEEQELANEERAARRKKWGLRVALVVSPLVLVLALFAAGSVWLSEASTSTADSEKGSPLVSTLRNALPVRIAAAWLCTTFTMGCAAAPLRPLPGDCPPEAVRAMEEMNVLDNDSYKGFAYYRLVIDIQQAPAGPDDEMQLGSFRSGKVVGRVWEYGGALQPHGSLPVGTLLYGELWTEGITKYGQAAIVGHYSEALLPDGRRFPVCIVLGADGTGLMGKAPGSKPHQTILPRVWDGMAVRIWP